MADVPIWIRILTSGTADAGNKIKDVANQASNLDRVWGGLARKLGAGLSIGALGAFVKRSVDFAAQFQDLSDQFGIGAGKLSGLTQAFQNVGGDVSTVETVLRRLKERSAEAGIGLEDYTESVISSYAATGDFAKLVEEVGARAAPKFAAAIREMGGSMKGLKGPVDDATAALTDFYGDKLTAGINRVRGFFAKGAAEAISFGEAYANAIKGFVSGDGFGKGFVDTYKKQNEAIREGIRLRKAAIEAEKQVAKQAEESASMSFAGGIAPLMSMVQSMLGAGAKIAGAQASLQSLASTQSSARQDDRVSGAIFAGSAEAAGLLARIRAGGTTDQRIAAENLRETKEQTKLLQDMRDALVTPTGSSVEVIDFGG